MNTSLVLGSGADTLRVQVNGWHVSARRNGDLVVHNAQPVILYSGRERFLTFVAAPGEVAYIVRDTHIGALSAARCQIVGSATGRVAGETVVYTVLRARRGAYWQADHGARPHRLH